MDLNRMGERAEAAGRALAVSQTGARDAAIRAIADMLEDDAATAALREANVFDVALAEQNGLSPALTDRLTLTPDRLSVIARDARAVADLPDPVGERYDVATLDSGLRVHKRRVPFGVIGVIYEARPNVTVDVAALCLKSGNAAILRGGKEMQRSCAALVALIAAALRQAGLPLDAVQSIDDPDRGLMQRLLTLDAHVDLIIPRGGAGLHRFCREHATIPVITGGIGICHVYVDAAAKTEYVVPIVANAKVQRPSVCNALDTLLVHRERAAEILPLVARDLLPRGVELRADEQSLAILRGAGVTDRRVVAAAPEDYGTEFMALVLAVRVVDGLEAALAHIARHGDHSDAIITEDAATAETFVAAVDSAAVFVNASTRFNDGSQLGLGAEIAVSTQKMHVRGPMGLRELTTYKWVVEGDGSVRA